MNERLKKLRRVLGLTQREFGERIGVKPNTISTYEIGRNEPIDAVISLICREFNVSEVWLRTGEGGIFVPDDKDALGAFIRDRNLTSTDRILIEKFVSLSTKARWEVVKYVLDIADMLWEECKTSVQQRTEPDLTAKVAELERQNQELAAKVSAMEKEDARMEAAEQPELTKKTKKMPKAKKNGSMIEIKVYDEPAAAGLGNYLDDPDFHIEQYPEYILPPGTDFGVRIDGDSMEPKIHNGYTVFVEAAPAIEPGQIGIFVLNDKAYCKKLVVDHERRQTRLVSLNSGYEDIVIQESDSFKTLGHVLGQWGPDSREDDFLDWIGQ